MYGGHSAHEALLVSALLLGAVSAGTGLAQPSAEAIEKRLRVIHKPECVSVGLGDFDLLRARFKGLRGAFALLDGSGGTVARCEVDFHAPTARSHVFIRKPPGAACAAVAVKLVDGEAVLVDKKLPLPPAVETQPFHALTDERVQAIPGASPASGGVPPVIAALRLPDYAKAETATWGAAERKIEVESTFRQVRCDINYPITGARNNSFIGRQTAHPDALERKSLYLSLRSSLFNPTTGEYEMDAKYLAEIPFDKAWLLPALAAEGDTNVAVPADLMRVHVGDKKVKSARLGEMYITGQRPDGLMQLIHSVCQDGDGNIYFAQESRGCIRLNIRKAEFEPVPVD
ncbi:MAG: hypothetical protein FJ278_12185, partial [Planctomycetes bacterium]|nr:hypothetical protein [Planctomycetota bacterium]